MLTKDARVEGRLRYGVGQTSRRRRSYLKTLQEDVTHETERSSERSRERDQRRTVLRQCESSGNLPRPGGAVRKPSRRTAKALAIAPEELLSLAMSSWLLGKVPPATRSRTTAVRLWKTRQLILKYEKTDDINLRQKMVAAALKERSGDDRALRRGSLAADRFQPAAHRGRRDRHEDAAGQGRQKHDVRIAAAAGISSRPLLSSVLIAAARVGREITRAICCQRWAGCRQR